MSIRSIPSVASVAFSTGIMLLTLMFGCGTMIASTPAPFKEVPPDIELAIVDASGQPIAGATVVLYSRMLIGTGVTKVATRTTGDDGRVRFTEPDPFNYVLYASAPGYLGASGFAQVNKTSALVADIMLRRVETLSDYAVGTISAGNLTISTDPPADSSLSQSSVTFDAGSVADGTEITIGSLEGVEVPVLPANQVALGAILVSISGDASSASATVNLGMPFTLPEGTVVPVYGFDEATGEWVEVGSGTVTDGQVEATISDFGAISALAGFVPQRTRIDSGTEIESIAIGPTDGQYLSYLWIPTIEFPEGTDYDAKTKSWLQGTVESIVNLRFGVPITSVVDRGTSTSGVLTILNIIDEYTITVNTGSASKAAKGASTQFRSRSRQRDQEYAPAFHTGGFGGAG